MAGFPKFNTHYVKKGAPAASLLLLCLVDAFVCCEPVMFDLDMLS